MNLLSWIASWADTLRVATYGPEILRDEVDGIAAWDAFQARAAAKKEAARLRHKAVKPIEAAQQSLVHSALSRSIPTASVAGGCSQQVTS